MFTNITNINVCGNLRHSISFVRYIQRRNLEPGVDTERHPTERFRKLPCLPKAVSVRGNGPSKAAVSQTYSYILHWTAGLGSCLRIVGIRNPHRYLAKGPSRGTHQIGQTAFANRFCHTSPQIEHSKYSPGKRRN